MVGIANSITGTADGWVAPGEIAALRTPGTPPTAQVLYRFAAAGSDAQIRADVQVITRALPAGAIVGSASWLTAQFAAAEGNGAIMEPFVIAFALIGLGQQASRQHADEAPDKGRPAHPAQVDRHHLGRGEADGLEHADPPGAASVGGPPTASAASRCHRGPWSSRRPGCLR